ncbi:MAG: hypothetical protein IJ841_10960 [Prevotella sp.]|nr:hypothetical protein [Prevotella sp.]
MKNFKNIFTLLVVALTGLSLTGCSEDDLDTNPFSQSGVNIVGFGPSPILRTNEIRITGTELGSVTAVAFPGNAVVQRDAFNNADGQNIYVNVPDESVPGKIRLLVGNDTVATSTSLLTFEEPIEVTSVSPTSGLSAGDEISIKGEYVYNIAEVVFTNGVTGAPVIAEDFTYTSRKEIRLRVPLAAETGTIKLNDGAEWEMEYKDTLQILQATYTAVSTTTAEFGQQITISGTNLHTVETVMFPGGVTSDFTVSDDHNTITTNVPTETKSGAITLVLYSGASITSDVVNVPTLAITAISKDADLRVGDEIVLTGENFDRITSVTLPGVGEFSNYKATSTTLTFTVPEGMTDGNMVLTQNSFISVTQKLVMHSDLPEQTIWAGEFTCESWSGNQELAWGGYDWSSVAAGTTLKFYYRKIKAGEWACISLRHGDSWGNLPDPIPGQYDLDEDEGVLSVAFPQNVLDDLVANGGLVITGANFVLTKVTVPLVSDEIDVASFSYWEDQSANISYPIQISWSENTGKIRIMRTGLADLGLKVGVSKLIFYKEGTGQIQLNNPNWGNPITDAELFDWEGEKTQLETVFTQEMMDCVTGTTSDGWSETAFIIQGDGLTITKITVLP